MKLIENLYTSKLPELAKAIDTFYEDLQLVKDNEAPRAYIGTSIIGHKCRRYLWLNFRWCVNERKSGRVLRLLSTGSREEDIAVFNLQQIGIDIKYTGLDQLNFDYGSHVKGHPDGLIISGVPTAEKSQHMWEHKTMNKANFEKLIKEGLQSSKPMHYAQVQCEMYGAEANLGYKVNRALYQVLCKDDSRIYAERVRLDEAYAQKLIKRAQDIATSDNSFPRLSESPSWYECKICPAYGICHQGELPCRISCRNCAHATATKDGTWICELYKSEIPTGAQLNACPWHTPHPDTVPWTLIQEKSTAFTACYKIGEQEVLVGGEGTPTTEIFKTVESVNPNSDPEMEAKE